MKKYMIGFFSVLFLITGCLIAGYQVSYNNLLEKEKAIELTKNEKNDSIDKMCCCHKKTSAHFLLLL